MARKPRILLIDDSELIREGLRLYLGSKFDVVTVSNASDALMQLGKIKFDLILTDLLMSAASGFGLISTLRQQHPGTPIIAMSGWGKPAEGDALKADTFLVKPFDLEVLDRSMSELLGQKIR